MGPCDWLTKLDISMQFFTFELDDESKPLTTFATPFGLYRCKRCPMGIKIMPEIAQELMDDLLKDIPEAIACFDDIPVTSLEWNQHLKSLDLVLGKLAEAHFSLNIDKCEFGVEESDFLGHWMTPTGLKPWMKKVKGVTSVQAPKNLKQLRSFLGLVGFCRTMWPKKAHVLAPLTDPTGSRFVWQKVHQDAFERMKALAATDAPLAWPDHSRPLLMRPDSSDCQLGAVITQKDPKTDQERPIACYSRKLNQAQRNCSTIEKEALGCVEAMNCFRTLLLGSDLTVLCDHKNFTHKLTQFKTQRVLRWRIFIDEFGAKFKHEKGEDDVLGDALSRVPTTTEVTESSETVSALCYDYGDECPPAVSINDIDDDDDDILCNLSSANERRVLDHQSSAYERSALNGRVPPSSEGPTSQSSATARSALHGKADGPTESFFSNPFTNQPLEAFPVLASTSPNLQPINVDNDVPDLSQTWKRMADSLMVHPRFDSRGRDPTDFATLRHCQQRDPTVLALPTQRPNECAYKDFDGQSVVCWLIPGSQDFRLRLADEMLPLTVNWHHTPTVHSTGAAALKNTLQRHCYHPRLSQAVETLTHSCTACEQMKKPAAQFGLLAPRQAPCAPWTEVHLDTIGPWSFAGKGNKRFSFFALAAIDPATNLMEIKRHTVVPGKHPSAAQTWNAFHDCWLCRCPKPLACLADNGPEFMGHDFQNAILHAQMRPKNSTVCNPQGNSVCERAHTAVAQVLRALLAQNNTRPDAWPEAEVLIDRALAITQHATRCAASAALCNQSPGSIAFGRDMLINVPFVADFMAIRNARQLKIDQRLLRADAKRRPRDFAVNEQIFVRNITAKSKLDPAWQGPFPIVRVHTNGAVTFARPNGVHERRNIRQIKPFA